MTQSSIAIRLQTSNKPTTTHSPLNTHQIPIHLWEEKWLRYLLRAFLSSLGYYSSIPIIKRQNNVVEVTIIAAPKNLLWSSRPRYIRKPLFWKPWSSYFWRKFQTVHPRILVERLTLYKLLWKFWFNTELVINLTLTKNIMLSSSLLAQVIRPNLLDSSLRSKFKQRVKATRIMAIYMRQFKTLIPWMAIPQNWKLSSEELKHAYSQHWYGYTYLLRNILMVYIWRHFTSTLTRLFSYRSPNNGSSLLSGHNPITYFKSNSFINWKNLNTSKYKQLPAYINHWMSLGCTIEPIHESMKLMYPYLIQIMRSIFWHDIQYKGIRITMTGQLHRHVRTARFKKRVGDYSFNSANVPSQHTHFHIRTRYGVWGFHIDLT